MKLKKINSIRWADAEKKFVRILGDLEEQDSVSIGTPYDETSILWEQIKSINISNILDYQPPSAEEVAPQILEQRLYLLRASDWTQLADVPLSAEKKAEWNTYRQALRDITLQEGYPFNVVFPTEPV